MTTIGLDTVPPIVQYRTSLAVLSTVVQSSLKLVAVKESKSASAFSIGGFPVANNLIILVVVVSS